MPDTLWTRLRRWFSPRFKIENPKPPQDGSELYQELVRPPDPPSFFPKEKLERIKKMSLIDAEKELHMARRIVKFSITDGRKPSRTDEVGKPFALKIPIAVKLAAGQSRRIKLGVSCNLPTIIVGKQGSLLFSPGKELEVDIVGEGPGQEVTNIGEGEVIAKAFPIDSSSLDLSVE